MQEHFNYEKGMKTSGELVSLDNIAQCDRHHQGHQEFLNYCNYCTHPISLFLWL
ncbi:hypothetical protein [Kamptonema animale]|uniref:hypothetical protein n=1 Tax=Kamptonema animale TaxID=92934 RepID=UPI0023309576|nr:hypothetical protein [Kamptonema animale]